MLHQKEAFRDHVNLITSSSHRFNNWVMKSKHDVLSFSSRDQMQLKAILEQIEALKPGARLLAVSKQQSIESIAAVYEAGQRHFGENYAQELVEKAAQLPSDIRWHFIGAIQSNKLKSLMQIPNLWAIETLDTAKHADLLNKYCQELNRTIRIFIQVNTSGESQKHGCQPAELAPLIQHLQQCSHLQLLGLMTIGSPTDSEGSFKCLSDLRATLLPGCQLSMGMSADWQLALQMGSDEVRLGTLIFGERTIISKSN